MIKKGTSESIRASTRKHHISTFKLPFATFEYLWIFLDFSRNAWCLPLSSLRSLNSAKSSGCGKSWNTVEVNSRPPRQIKLRAIITICFLSSSYHNRYPKHYQHLFFFHDIRLLNHKKQFIKKNNTTLIIPSYTIHNHVCVSYSLSSPTPPSRHLFHLFTFQDTQLAPES